MLFLSLMAAGWLLMALVLVPWLRDFMAAGFIAGGSPRLAQAWPPPRDVLALGVTAVVLLLAGAVPFVIWSGRAGGLGSVVEDRLRNSRRLALAIALWAAVISAAILAGGEPTIADANTHISRSWIWEQSLRSGKIPVWTDLWYGGFLVDQQYSPLSHVLVALAGLLGIPPSLAAKLVVWLASVAGAVGFGLCCHSFHRSRQAGMLGGVIYSLLPTIDAEWMWQGRLPGVVLMGILPWAFLALHRLARGAGGRRAAAGLALCLTAMVLTHAIQARLALAMLAAYSLVEFTAPRRARAGWMLIGWCAAAAMSLCFLIPVYVERGFVNGVAAPLVAASVAKTSAAIVGHIFRWSPRGDWYPGITVMLLMLLGMWSLVSAVRRGDRQGRDVVAVLAVIAAPWAFVGLQPGNAGPLFVGAAMAASACVAQARGWRQSHLLFAATLLLLIDTGPANLVSTYATHRGEKQMAYERVEAAIGAGSYLELPLGPSGSPRSSYWHYVPTRPVACVAGPFIQGAPRSFAYRAALIDTVASALADGSNLSDPLIKFLAFENVRLIAISSPTTVSPPLLPIPPGIEQDSRAPAWRVAEASPVSIVDSLADVPLPDPPHVGSLGIESDTPRDRTASRNVISAVLSWMASAKPNPVAGVALSRRPNAVDLTVPDVGGRTLRIALAPFPTISVRVDGEPVSWRGGGLGGILVDVAPGSHKISIECAITRIRFVLGILFALIAAGVCVLGVIPAKARPDRE